MGRAPSKEAVSLQEQLNRDRIKFRKALERFEKDNKIDFFYEAVQMALKSSALMTVLLNKMVPNAQDTTVMTGSLSAPVQVNLVQYNHDPAPDSAGPPPFTVIPDKVE